MKSVRTTLAYAAAIALLAFGLLALLNPLVAVRLVGLEVVEPRGLSEIRSSYGALLLALGGAMLWAIPTRPRSVPWLRFGGLLFLAATLGRVASVLLDGVWTPLNLIVTVLAGVVAVAFLLASFQARPGRAAGGDDAAVGPPAERPRRRGLLGRRRRSDDAAPEGIEADDEDAPEDASDPLRALRS
jgi:hypothetical protein